MKKFITLLLTLVMLLSLLVGCRGFTLPEGLSGSDAAKLLLANERLNAQLLKTEGDIFENGVEVDMIAGFRNEDIVILEDEMKKSCTNLYITTDDGSYGEKGFVTDKLKSLIESGREYDEVFAIGPAMMMKFACLATKPYGIKTIVSLNPIMIDGTGMCGGCRVTVGGKTKFACVDGPEFDGHEVDWDELIRRNAFYKEEETEEKEHVCHLTGGVRRHG